MDEERSIRQVCVRISPNVVVVLPWESAQAFVTRCIAAYPTTHRVVDQFRAVGVSRPVDLTEADDRTFALAVIEEWTAQVSEDELPRGISELREALHDGVE